MMPAEDNLCSTGGQIDSIVRALVESSCDREDVVTQAVQASLLTLGRHHPSLLLSSCHAHITTHPKLALVHKIILLSVMEKICNEASSSTKIERQVALDIIKLAVEEMVNTKEIVPEWQGVASSLLVSVGERHVHEVMEQLLTRFQPGTLPHFFILQTMANLATRNVFGMVPFLKSVIGTMLPLLGMVKSENMKWIFAYALGKFCEAILEYIANSDDSPDTSVTKESFSAEVTSAYEVLFNNWLSSREAKVRGEVCVCLGTMSHLLQPDKLEEHLPRLLPALVALYRRQHELHQTTQGLCMILDAAVSKSSLALESQLESILNALFPQVCSTPDYSQPSGVRNHNEVLRCFAVLGGEYSTRVVSFLLLRLEGGGEPQRVGALTVLRHLINTTGGPIGSKVPLIICGIKQILNSSNKVKKVLAQVVVTLAHHDHLHSDDGLELVRFIVHQCALPDALHDVGRRPPDPGYVSAEALRGMCENVMHLLTTTVDRMEELLWPKMVDWLLDESLCPAVGVVCKSLTTLATRERQELGMDITIDYAALGKVVTPHGLLARLLVLGGCPLEPALHLLKALGPAIHKGPVSLWDQKIPALIQQIEGGGEGDGEERDLVTRELVSETLSHIGQEEWIVSFGKNLLYQFPLYASTPHGKRSLLQTLGLVLGKVSDKVFLNEALDAIFNNVNHSDPAERRACAEAVGWCGFPDLVLVKLETVAKGKSSGGGILSFIRDFGGDSVELEKLRATVVLCYGHLTARTPITQIASRIETPILRCIANFYSASHKDVDVKSSMLESVRLIAGAVQGELRSRGELLAQMRSILKAPAPLHCSLALNAAAALLGLDPPLKEDEKVRLVGVAVTAVYPLPSGSEEEEGALNHLLKQMLAKENTFDNLEAIIKMLHPWLLSRNSVERERSLHSCLHLLQAFAQSQHKETYAVPFVAVGGVLGLVVPRCTDPQLTVRHLAFDTIDVALAIPGQVPSVSFNESPEFSLQYLKAQVVSDDPNSLFTVTKNLGKVLCERLPLEQLYPLVRGVVGGLCDPLPQSSSGAAVLLDTIIRHRGRELRVEMPHILDAVRNVLGSIQCPQTHKGALRVFQSLANHHLPAVLGALLDTPVPFDQNTIDIWKTLCLDRATANHIVENFLEIFSDNVIASPPDPHGRSSAAHKPLAAVCALREMFRVPEMSGCALDHFDRLLASLLLVAGTYQATQKAAPAPIRLCVETLRHLLVCVGEEGVVAAMQEDGQWAAMEEEEHFPDAVSALARHVCVSCPGQVARLASFCSPLLASPTEMHRVVSASLLGPFLQGALTEPLLNGLMGRLADPSPTVRRICLRGLGNTHALDPEQVERYSVALVSAMVSGLEDGACGLQAMAGLSSLLHQVAPQHVKPIDIALRIRPLCHKDEGSIRAAAFSLLGELGRFGEGFSEQVHSCLPPLLLHLNEHDANVAKACQGSLCQLCPLLGSSGVEAVCQKHLSQHHLHYTDFLNELTKALISDFPDRVGFYATTSLSYLKSPFLSIQCNAATLLGYLLSNLPVEKQDLVEKERICSGLLLLLKEPMPEVRVRTAQALALLHQC